MLNSNIKRVTAPIRIIVLDRATAMLAENPNNSRIGRIAPPPPIPAELVSITYMEQSQPFIYFTYNEN